MSHTLTASEAAIVSKQYQEMFDRLNSVKGKYKTSVAFTVRTAGDLSGKGTFSDWADAELSGEWGLFSGQDEIKGFLYDLYTSFNLSLLVEQIKSTTEKPINNIRRNLEKIQPVLSSLRWFFTSSKKKAEAAEAFDYLCTVLEGNFPAYIDSIVSRAAEIENPQYAEVTHDFDKNRGAYFSFLRQNAPNIEWDNPSGKIGELTASQKPFLDDLDQCEQAVRERKEIVTRNIQALAAKQAMKTLKEIPVEELRSSKDNVRIKALRDEGYETLADVYSATVNQIGSVYGISMDSARAIKRRAKEMVEETQRTTRIKLSADDRTREASYVIAAVYDYKRRKPDIDKYEKLKSQGIGIIRDDHDQLLSIGNGAKLLFSDEPERERFCDSFQRLNWLRNNNFGSYISTIKTNILTKLPSTDSEAWNSFIHDPAAFFTIIEEIVPGALGNNDSLYGLPEDLAQEIQDEAFFPDGLLCTLRRYQEWGVKYILHQEKVLLGDEMGLGKTIQAIAAMVSLKNTGEKHFLVVCPASVITNWFREIRKSSKLRATIVHGYGKAAAFKDWKRTGGVAITSYESTGSLETDDDFHIGLLIVDEAHYIKNTSAKRSENVRKLCEKTDRLLFMTGTALENKVEEMISLINVLRPEIAQKISPMAYMSRAPQFREAIAPVYYRRKREDVLTELPDLVEKEEWCSLLPQEEHIYEQAVLKKYYAGARRVSWSVGIPKESSKAQRLKELVDEAASDGRKVLVFSFFLDTIEMVIQTLGDRCVNPINGSINPQRRQQIIDEFEKAPAGTVLPAQIISGGTGLNIQSASVVIICEPQLKPSIENQAISRAYRMGQARNVFVFRLLCENTIDERITEMLQEKQAVFDAFADKSVAAQQSVELDSKTLDTLIQEEIDRINKKNENTTKRT